VIKAVGIISVVCIDGNFADNFTIPPRPIFSSIFYSLRHNVNYAIYSLDHDKHLCRR